MIWLFQLLMLIKFQKDSTTFEETKLNFTGRIYNFFHKIFLIGLKFNNFLVVVKITLIHPKHDCLIFYCKLLVSFTFDYFLSTL